MTYHMYPDSIRSGSATLPTSLKFLFLCVQDKGAHHELMEHSDFILFNITDGLNAMDKIRFRLLDMNNHPIAIAHVPRR